MNDEEKPCATCIYHNDGYYEECGDCIEKSNYKSVNDVKCEKTKDDIITKAAWVVACYTGDDQTKLHESLSQLDNAFEEYHRARKERENMEYQDKFSKLCKSVDEWYSSVNSRSSFGPLVSDNYMMGAVKGNFTDDEQKLIQKAIFNLSPQIIREAGKILIQQFEQEQKAWEEEKKDIKYIIEKLNTILKP